MPHSPKAISACLLLIALVVSGSYKVRGLYSQHELRPTLDSATRDGLPSLSALNTTSLTPSLSPQQSNNIVTENQLPGNPPSEWDVVGGGDPAIQGFATDISVNRGQTIEFKINNTSGANYHIDIYRLGYYRGAGARRVAAGLTPTAPANQFQPPCLTDPSVLLYDCGNWAVSASWNVPSNAVSGIYIAKLVRQDTGTGSHIIFVVRDDAGHSDLLFQTSDTTWQAYNNAGGNSLYTGPTRAKKVSYNRPFNTHFQGNSFFFSEYPMVRWLEANGYNVSYFTGVDTARRGQELLEHKVFLSVGHDEYWSGEQRSQVEAARDAGINLAFFSGNKIYWKIRWEKSIDASATPWRTLVCYKETHDNAYTDPLPNTWTGTWRDPLGNPPYDGGHPENALAGTIFTVNGFRDDDIVVPYAYRRLRFWRNTTVSTAPASVNVVLPLGTLGNEWDEDLDNGYRPAGLISLSSTTKDVQTYILDQGSTFGPGRATHSLTLYRHPSGALVFAAGTIQWSWGVDSTHDAQPNQVPPPADVRMQQATVNLLADLGAQPGSLQPGLVLASASTDTTPPTAAITSPANNTSLTSGVVISGTASDGGGGVVAGVEVSVDGGSTWHTATGQDSWTYRWTPAVNGTYTIRARAIDDSGNVGSSSSITVNLTLAAFEGWHDGTDCNFIYGWAWDRHQPNTPINVDVYRDNVFVSTVAANQFRSDLLNAGKGNGYHAFFFATPPELRDGRTHTVRVQFAGTGVKLSGSPQSIKCGLPPSYEGWHDGADCNFIYGWGWDRNQPNTPISVDIYADGILIGTVTADRFRQDLLAAGKGNGYHGFIMQTPASLRDGQPHTIRVRFTGSVLNLSATPKNITCGASTLTAGINVALATNGATVKASSTYNSSYPASAAINGDRKGLNWGNGGGWNDATMDAYPDWLEVDFNGSQTINEIDVFTLQDNYASPIEPTDTLTFSQYGITDFQVQYDSGGGWVTVPGGSVTSNNLVKRKFTFTSITTSRIRVLVNNSLAHWSRITEIEAY